MTTDDCSQRFHGSPICTNFCHSSQSHFFLFCLYSNNLYHITSMLCLHMINLGLRRNTILHTCFLVSCGFLFKLIFNWKKSPFLFITFWPQFLLLLPLPAFHNLSVPQIHSLFVSSSENSRPPRENSQTGKKKQDPIRQDKSPHIETGQGNPKLGKDSQEQAKESKIHLLPLLGVL